MICQSTYDSLDQIPETLREEFHSINGRWELKPEAIPGVGPLFNKALAANEIKAVGQVKTRNERIRILEEENNSLKDKISVIDIPGSKVLSAEDAKNFDIYATLGTPKEIQEKLKQLPELQQQVAKTEMTSSIGKIATAAGINTEVLTDWATSQDSSHLKFVMKSVEQTDAKGVKFTSEVPHVQVSTVDGGTTKVEEKELLPFAKETLPEWKYQALTVGKAAQSPGNTPKPAIGTRLPDLGSAQRQAPAGETKRRAVDIANEQRANRPSPFAPKAPSPTMSPNMPSGFAGK